jgi:hypothetical protein
MQITSNIVEQLKNRIEYTKITPFQNAFTRGYLLAMEHALQLVEREIKYAN